MVNIHYRYVVLGEKFRVKEMGVVRVEEVKWYWLGWQWCGEAEVMIIRILPLSEFDLTCMSRATDLTYHFWLVYYSYIFGGIRVIGYYGIEN